MKCLTFIEMAIRWQGQLVALKLQIGFRYFTVFRPIISDLSVEADS